MEAVLKALRRILLGLLIAGILFYAGVVAMVMIRCGSIPQAENYDAIIVLGAQVKPDGTPNLQLQWRLDAAIEAWQRRRCVLVVCGAQGDDEPAPEGEVMYGYLVDHGIPAEDVLKDTSSFNTRENLRNAAALLAEREGLEIRRVAIVTSDYHVARALSLARDEGFADAQGIPSPTLGGWYRVKNLTREGVAWIKYWAEKLTGFQISNSNFKVKSITRTN